MKIPFHRRIVPWLFALIFIFMAPAVVFYTAGYRWNSNKGVIERNGTLMFDTVPRGATIILNGQVVTQVTPYTLQNVAPGNYDISLKLNGYFPWSKNLPVEPERVTFATGIVLWPEQQPSLVSDGVMDRIFSDPSGASLVTISRSSSGETRYALMDTDTNAVSQRTTSTVAFDARHADWSAAADGAILYGSVSGTPQTWFLPVKSLKPSPLPNGIYHWDRSEMVGFADDQRLSVKSDGSVERTPSQETLYDQIGDYSLVNVTGTESLVLTSVSQNKQGSVLPPGNWQFRIQDNKNIILQAGREWLWLNLETQPFSMTRATGEWLWPLTLKRETRYLIKNANEIWVWEKGHEPDLIYRQSEPLVAVAWHAEGKDVMAVSKNEVMMINLDARNGRFKTTLANFDSINDAALAGDAIFVAATKNGRSGLWRLPLALPTSVIPSFGGF